jgi:DNA-binding transcriptional LysR family regulator
MDRLAAIGVFVQVAERRSFSAAGRHLGMAASTVSKHVSELEAWLGARLLHRTTRNVSLTQVGADFYKHCCRIIHEVEEARTEATGLQRSPSGLLRVNAPFTFALLHVMPLVPAFLERYPRLQVDVHLDDQKLDPIEGGFDVTIRIAPILRSSTLVRRKLAPNRLMVCGAPSYLARYGTPKTPQELGQHRCLLYTNSSSPSTWRFGKRGEISVAVSGAFQSNSGDALRGAAVAGLGLIQTPAFLAGVEVRAGSLQAVLEEYETPMPPIHAHYQPGRVPAKVKAFVDFLVEHLGTEPSLVFDR